MWLPVSLLDQVRVHIPGCGSLPWSCLGLSKHSSNRPSCLLAELLKCLGSGGDSSFADALSHRASSQPQALSHRGERADCRVGAAPRVGTPPALPAALSGRDALRVPPRESLVSRGTRRRLCPCVIRGVAAQRVPWGMVLPAKCQLAQCEVGGDDPSSPSAVLRVLGSEPECSPPTPTPLPCM